VESKQFKLHKRQSFQFSVSEPCRIAFTCLGGGRFKIDLVGAREAKLAEAVVPELRHEGKAKK